MYYGWKALISGGQSGLFPRRGYAERENYPIKSEYSITYDWFPAVGDLLGPDRRRRIGRVSAK
jgi:hypothetical protein